MGRNNGRRTKRQADRNATRVFDKPVDYSARYDGDYEKNKPKYWKLHEEVGSLCVCCLKRKAEELHHTNYGNDRFGFNLFPVCLPCHDKYCHNKKNWVAYKRDGKINPTWNNHNTEEFTRRLKLGFDLLYSK